MAAERCSVLALGLLAVLLAPCAVQAQGQPVVFIIGWEQSSYTVTEANGVAEACFTVTTTNDTLPSGATVNVTAQVGTATSGEDFSISPTGFNITGSNSRVCANISVIDDDISEGLEMFTLTLTSENAAVVINQGTASIELLDSTAFVVVPASTSALRGSNATFDCSPSATSPIMWRVDTVLVTPASHPGRGISAESFGTSSVLTVLAVEVNQGAQIRCIAGPSASTDLATLTVQFVVIGFEQTVYDLDEVTGVNATYPLCVIAADPSQLGGQLQPSFSFTVDNQTATDGEDYFFNSLGPFTITLAVPRVCINITVLADNLMEGATAEYLVLSLNTAEEFVTITPAVATVFIHDVNVGISIQLSVPGVPASTQVSGLPLSLLCELAIEGELLPPVYITWRNATGNFVNVTGQLLVGPTVQQTAGAMSTLTLPAVRTSQGGDYECFAHVSFVNSQLRNVSAADSVTVSVEIAAPMVNVTLVSHPSPAVFRGSDLTLSCTLQALTPAVDTAIQAVNVRWTISTNNGTSSLETQPEMNSPSVFSVQLAVSDLQESSTYTCQGAFVRDTQAPINPSLLANDSLFIEVLERTLSVELAGAPYAVSEGSGLLTVCVILLGIEVPENTSASVDLSSANASASAGGDFVAVQERLSFPSNSVPGTQRCVNISIIDDSVIEGPQEFGLVLSVAPESQSVTFSGTNTTVTILDNDFLIIGFEASEYQIDEDAGSSSSLTICVRANNSLSLDPQLAPSFTVEAQNGTAIDGVDFQLSFGGPFTVTQGSGVFCVDVSAFSDTLVEGGEFFTLALTTQADYVILDPNNTTVLINDDEELTLSVEFSGAPYTVSEDAGSLTVCVSLLQIDFPPNSIASVVVTSTDNSAVAGGDFVAVQETLSFSSNSVPGTQRCVNISIIDDSVIEGPQEFGLLLSVAPESQGVTFSGTNTTVTILDNDFLIIGFEASEYQADEDAGTISSVSICVRANNSLSLDPQLVPTFTVEALSGTAIDGVDFQLLFDGIFTVTQEIGFFCFEIGIISDTLVEGGEFFTLALTTQADYVILDPNNTTVLINDDEELTLSVEFSGAPYTVSEDAGSLTVCVSLLEIDFPPNSIASVVVTSTDNSAVANGDFVAVQETLSFPSNSVPGTQRCVNISIIDDSVIEGPQEFGLLLSVPPESQGVTFSGANTSVTILDNDLLIIGFEASEYQADEDAGTFSSVSICVRANNSLSLDPQLAPSFTVEAQNGTANDGVDFQLLFDGTFTVTQEIGFFCFEIGIISDTLVEGGEFFTLALTTQADYVILDPSNTTVLINDDEELTLSVEFSGAPYTVSEDAGSLTVCVSLLQIDFPPNSIASVVVTSADNSAVAGGDFVAVQETLSFPSNSVPGTQRCVNISIIDDSVIEGPQEFGLLLSVPPESQGVTFSGANTSVTILDNDLLIIGFEASEYQVDEDSGSISFICVRANNSLSLDPQLAPSFTVEAQSGTAIDGVDFQLSFGGPFTVTQESGFFCVDVVFFDDTLVEGGEFFTLALTTQADYVILDPNNTTLLINDDEVLLVAVDFESPVYMVPEEGGDLSVCVELVALSPSLEANISVSSSSGTAIEGEDFLAVQETVLFPQGSLPGTERCVNISIIDDDMIEGAQQFSLSLSLESDYELPVTFNSSTADVVIIDNDFLVIGFAQPEYDIDEDIVSVSQLCVDISNADILSVSPVPTFSIRAENGTAFSGVDFNLQAPGVFVVDGEANRVCVDVEIINDAVPEGGPAENFTLTLSTNSSVVILNPPNATVVIHDDDVPFPTVSLSRSEEGVLTSGDPLLLTCDVSFIGELLQPIEIVWQSITQLQAITLNNTEGFGIVIEPTDASQDGASSTLNITTLPSSLAGLIQCAYTLRSGNPALRGGPIGAAVNTTVEVQLAAPLVFVAQQPQGLVYRGQDIVLLCSFQFHSSINTDVQLSNVQWEITGNDMSTVINATTLNMITAAVFSTELPVTQLSNEIYRCSGSVVALELLNLTTDSEEGSNSIQIEPVEPPLNVAISPQSSTIFDVPPFNVYTLTCTASLPPSINAQTTLNVVWLDGLETRQPIQSSSLISINTTYNSSGLAVTSVLQGIEERSGGDLAVFAACEVSAVLARAEGDVLLVTDTSPNAIVQVLGPSPPESVTDVAVTAVSHQLAVVEWVVPFITFTPETYFVEYTYFGDESAQRSVAIPGNANISVTDEEFHFVLQGLNADADISVLVISQNGNPLEPFVTASDDIFFTTLPDNIYPDDFNPVLEVPLGARIALRFDFSDPPISSPFMFVPINHSPLQDPTLVLEPGLLSAIVVSYDNASPSLNGDYILCVGGISPGEFTESPTQEQSPSSTPPEQTPTQEQSPSSTPPEQSTFSTQPEPPSSTDSEPTITPPPPLRRRNVEPGPSGEPLLCGSTVTIVVTVPTLTISPSLLVFQYDGSSLVGDTLPQVNCTPSDLRAPVMWASFFASRTIFDLNIEFSPIELSHTATFARDYFPTPPNRTDILVCDLVNVDQPLVPVDPQRVTVRFIQAPVALLNNDRELPSDAVINMFPIWAPNNVLLLNLVCLSTAGNDDLVFTARDVPAISGAITQELADSIEGLNVTYAMNADQRDVVISYAPFSAEKSGFYSCMSEVSGYSVEVFTTLTDPYWEYTTPSTIEVPLGAEVVFTARYADLSTGYQNQGSGFNYELSFMSSPETQPQVVSSGNTRREGNSVTISFSAALGLAGIYQLNATHLNSQTTYFGETELVVSETSFVELDSEVYVRAGTNVTLRCVPLDLRAPVQWQYESASGEIVRNISVDSDPQAFLQSPPGLNHFLSFSSEVAIQQDFPIGLLVYCGFRNGSSSPLVGAARTFVIVQPGRLMVQQSEGFRQPVLNNTVINTIPQQSLSKRAAFDYSYESPPDYDYPNFPNGLTLDCSGSQGDHMTRWRTDNVALGQGENGEVSTEALYGCQQLLSNYTTRLEFAFVLPEFIGNYFCVSEVSGLSTQFLLTLENPYVRRVSEEVVTVDEGSPVTLEYIVATDSDGLFSNTADFYVSNSTHTQLSVPFETYSPDFPRNFALTFPSVRRYHSGVYTASAQTRGCSREGPTGGVCGQVVENITLNVIVYCPREVVAGLQWARTQQDSTARVPCSAAGSLFTKGPLASVRRYCKPEGTWGDPDFSGCTLVDDPKPSILVWMVLRPFDDRRRRRATGVVDNPELIAEYESEFEELLANNEVMFESVRVQSAITCPPSSQALSFEVLLSLPHDQQSAAIGSFIDFINDELSDFAGFLVEEFGRGYLVTSTSDTCGCFEQPAEGGYSFLQICSGTSFSPCECDSTFNCRCTDPYVGDGSFCTLDSDGDGFPDQPLDSTQCLEIQPPYCIQDVCVNVSNPDQDRTACDPDIPAATVESCPYGPDEVWEIVWPNTERGTVSTQRCPGGLDAIGSASRFCGTDGNWTAPDVLECESLTFLAVRIQAESAFTVGQSMSAALGASGALTAQLALVTTPQPVSLLPQDLNTTNNIITDILSVLEAGLEEGNASDSSSELIDVFDNVLAPNNNAGWMALQMVDTGSQLLLDSAERYGLYLANALNETDSTQLLSRPNIVVRAKRYSSESTLDAADLQFPESRDLVNYSTSVNPASVIIPQALLAERLSDMSSEPDASISLVHMLFQNIEAFLPTSLNQLNNTRGASVVLSTQVGVRQQSTQSQALLQEPVALTFNFDDVKDEEVLDHICAYWNFSNPVGSGSWVTEGITTISNSSEGNTTTVQCSSTHLTSFAVLVTVSAVVIPPAEARALQIISYIGCAFSVICLGIAIIFFILQGKKLFAGVHYFVHLNLALSLFLAFLLFLIGIETATGSTGGCAFVAVLLHYLFLSAFCWMLCEGVMLYLMLVVVFSTLSKKWWFFLIIGYVTPIPIVVITLASRHQFYGVRDETGELIYCWLSTEKGTIFGFVAPMLAIILLNIVFLCFALRSLWKNKKSQLARKSQDEDKKLRELFKSTFLAAVILLPLLGLTWSFGILTVNVNTTAFAWLFTIFNSLQGVTILFFHVIRNDKIWNKIGPRLSTLRNKTLRRRKYEVDSGTSTLSKRGATKSGTFSSKSTEHTYEMGTLKSKASTSGAKSESVFSSSEKQDLGLQSISEHPTVAMSDLEEGKGIQASPEKFSLDVATHPESVDNKQEATSLVVETSLSSSPTKALDVSIKETSEEAPLITGDGEGEKEATMKEDGVELRGDSVIANPGATAVDSPSAVVKAATETSKTEGNVSDSDDAV